MLCLRLLMIVTASALVTSCATAPERVASSLSDQPWWKGNTHTHTLWSDGDGAPELVADWYRSRGYHFLVLSDHNILSKGERWFAIASDSRLTPDRLQELRDRFGDGWVVERTNYGQQEMRLKTLDELRVEFEQPGQFIFIQGEELTDSFDSLPVHVNGVNIEEVIPPQGGVSVVDTMQRNIDAVIEQGRRLNRPVLAHVNHPNFGWALTTDDIAAIKGERLFEVYNGHSSVRNYGDAIHPSLEEMWDLALTERLTETDLGLLYGVATDDAHHYFGWGAGHPNPGRGWVMVQADTLDADSIIQALRQGHFYSTTGVVLRGIDRKKNILAIHIAADDGVQYTTQFIGTRRSGEGTEHGPIGEVLFETTDNPAVYRLSGDELYVRATVTSTRPHPNPYQVGDMECAWVQPVIP